jgi:hypothetical protein
MSATFLPGDITGPDNAYTRHGAREQIRDVPLNIGNQSDLFVANKFN